jgi:hypothetical protein
MKYLIDVLRWLIGVGIQTAEVVATYLLTEHGSLRFRPEPFPLNRKSQERYPEMEAPRAVNPSRSEPEGLGVYSEDDSRKSGGRKRRSKPVSSENVDDPRQQKLFG